LLTWLHTSLGVCQSWSSLISRASQCWFQVP